MTFDDQWSRMDSALQRDLLVMADNAGFPNEPRKFCEALAVAARLGEISLREPPVS